MARPCFLVVDREYPASISSRKLVIETAKFNVITAYSGSEALESIARFPAVDAVVLDSGLSGEVSAPDLVKGLKQRFPATPVIVIGGIDQADFPGADHHLNYYEPANLLKLLQSLCPAESAAIDRKNSDLRQESQDSQP